MGGIRPRFGCGNLSRPDLDIVPCVPEPEPAYILERGANPISVHSALKGQLRDPVRHCFIDSPDEDAFVIIGDSESNPDLGFVNKNTVVPELLGGAIGQKRDVALPIGNRTIRVLEILA